MNSNGKKGMVGTDNTVSVQSVKAADCFFSEDGTVFSKILNLLFCNLIHREKRVLASLPLVMIKY